MFDGEQGKTSEIPRSTGGESVAERKQERVCSGLSH